MADSKPGGKIWVVIAANGDWFYYVNERHAAEMGLKKDYRVFEFDWEDAQEVYSHPARLYRVKPA